MARVMQYVVERLAVSSLTDQAENFANGYPPPYGPDTLLPLYSESGEQRYIQLKDVPRLPDGQFDPEWLDDNCGCETHMEERRLRGS